VTQLCCGRVFKKFYFVLNCQVLTTFGQGGLGTKICPKEKIISADPFKVKIDTERFKENKTPILLYPRYTTGKNKRFKQHFNFWLSFSLITQYLETRSKFRVATKIH